MDVTATMSNERNTTIDAFRGIACILVVFIHYPFPGRFGILVKAYARVAVPFFFLVSGYFTNKTTVVKTKKEVSKRITNMIRLCCVAVLASLILEYVFFYRGYSVKQFFEGFFKNISLKNFLIFNDTGSVTHLWFLFALLYCYFIMCFILKLNYQQKILPMIDSIVVLLWSCSIIIACLENYGFFNMEVCYYRNAFFIGFPFFWVGYRLRKIKTSALIDTKIFIAGLFLLFSERVMIGDLVNSIGISIVTIGIFLFAINGYNGQSCHLLSMFGRECSLLVYFIHWYVRYVEYKIIAVFHLTQSDLYIWISPFMVALYSVVLSIIIHKIIIRLKKNLIP